MSCNDPTNKLRLFEKRQLASILHSGITVDSKACDPWTRTSLSLNLLSSRTILWKKTCHLHRKLKAELGEFILNLIKYEVGDRVKSYAEQRKRLRESEKYLVNYLQQLNNMWKKDASFVNESHEPIKGWFYQENRCDACMVGRVARDATALGNLLAFLEARAPPREDVSPPRLLVWMKMFSYCHKCLRPPPEQVPEQRRQPYWAEATMATIDRWHHLGASPTSPTHKNESGHDLGCYTPAKISPPLAVGRMENDVKRLGRALQQPARDQLPDRSSSNISNSSIPDLSRNYHSTSDHFTISRPWTPNEEPYPRGYDQRGNPPYPDTQAQQSRRHSVASVSSNYSLSPPSTPSTEQISASGYNDASLLPVTHVVRTAAATVTAAMHTCMDTREHGSNGNFDTEMQCKLGLDSNAGTDSNAYISHSGDGGRSNSFPPTGVTKTTQDVEDDSPRTPYDSDSVWDDEPVTDSDERDSHHSDEDGDGDSRSACYDVANCRPWDLDSKRLGPSEEARGLLPPKNTTSRASGFTTWNRLIEDRAKEWKDIAPRAR
ncbi:predicted protein [Histoplasma capsulatum G186AR]|uniref:Uncharacterized protein n=2 Tax=Ajellomyces capsulatus TaxID=5037 RepID=C0NEB9_AJECG|nr:uncharacterized protein HCBG_01235 [Histoplasma capsulatum G186AR]EEH09590.1 predicted protein [Histoplasma capsulatum G186AR]KAG5288993.1 hypothetical protein I7I52_12661 [Histoplasma capsulatum]QSS73399.1 hypothetical protein I7I50_01545 [Histoplasma capsulatum G186AR]